MGRSMRDLDVDTDELLSEAIWDFYLMEEWERGNKGFALQADKGSVEFTRWFQRRSLDGDNEWWADSGDMDLGDLLALYYAVDQKDNDFLIDFFELTKKEQVQVLKAAVDDAFGAGYSEEFLVSGKFQWE